MSNTTSGLFYFYPLNIWRNPVFNIPTPIYTQEPSYLLYVTYIIYSEVLVVYDIWDEKLTTVRHTHE